MAQRSTTPIKFPLDPFDPSLEEEPISASRSSMNHSRISSEAHGVDGQGQVSQQQATSPRPSMSARPSFDSAIAPGSIAGTVTEKGTLSGKRSHVRSPSSPTRMVVNSPSFLGLGRRAGGASTSALSLHQHIHEHDPQKSGPYIHMPSPTSMVDASVYDFDIYRQPEDIPHPPSLPAQASTSISHPPPASIARLSAALSISDPYGSAGSKKRFSASMSDLPAITNSSETTLPASGASKYPFPYSAGNRMSASMSTNNLTLHNRESMIGSSSLTTTARGERTGLEPTTNLYVPKESLDLPP
ncbi:hypothetical protein FRC17_005572 [Serendipita sp. 399]|nr:hypothetical protein FRC17_005572 [Serendipita sp. 399]